MSRVETVVEYPEEGFAIISDDKGKYLAFRDNIEIEDLPDDSVEQWDPRRAYSRALQVLDLV